jgi:hypothetical protein
VENANIGMLSHSSVSSSFNKKVTLLKRDLEGIGCKSKRNCIRREREKKNNEQKQ